MCAMRGVGSGVVGQPSHIHAIHSPHEMLNEIEQRTRETETFVIKSCYTPNVALIDFKS